MSATAKKLFVTWFVGVVIGTAVIALTSPLFLRSYRPLHVDSVRGVFTLAQTRAYRWRSEGYADSVIGRLGMPGRNDLPDADADTVRVALWGDSQAEGFAVSDEYKIFAQSERLAEGDSRQLVVLPFARSGEDASDWVPQFSRVEAKLAIDVHVILMAEVVDLKAAGQSSDDLEPTESKFGVSNHVPAFVIQAARNLLTTGEGVSSRKLRFSLGPVAKNPQSTSRIDLAKVDWQTPVRAINAETKTPVVLVYAPVMPSIVSGNSVTIDQDAIEFERLKQIAQAKGIVVVDLRDELVDSARRGKWPHGFHNGQIGSGHLNQIGNEIVARGVIRAIEKVFRRADESSN